MNTNIFSNCITESEIMKTLFDTQATDTSIPRALLLSMANQRRSELGKTKPHTLQFNKIIIPVTDVNSFKDSVTDGSVIFSQNPKLSTTFEILGDGVVRF